MERFIAVAKARTEPCDYVSGHDEEEFKDAHCDSKRFAGGVQSVRIWAFTDARTLHAEGTRLLSSTGDYTDNPTAA